MDAFLDKHPKEPRRSFGEIRPSKKPEKKSCHPQVEGGRAELQ
tara:strand:- start:303 stop:431 length:129 start_codon:yes stop_codon:yes gene_type:complete